MYGGEIEHVQRDVHETPTSTLCRLSEQGNVSYSSKTMPEKLLSRKAGLK